MLWYAAVGRGCTVCMSGQCPTVLYCALYVQYLLEYGRRLAKPPLPVKIGPGALSLQLRIVQIPEGDVSTP